MRNVKGKVMKGRSVICKWSGLETRQTGPTCRVSLIARLVKLDMTKMGMYFYPLR
jgi:hypothetical protein